MTTTAETQLIVRSKGLCGALVENDTHVCILEAGHDNGVHAVLWTCDDCGQTSADEHAPCACDETDRGEILAKLKAATERAAHFEKRNEELRATLVRVTQENPFPEELRGWHDQRAKLIAEIGTLKARVVELEAIGPHSQLDGVYRERNRLVAMLARYANSSHSGWARWFSSIGRHQPDPDPHWDPEWLNVVFINTPEGQLSWHIHEHDLSLFDDLPRCDFKWDGHTTEEKYERLARLFR